MAATVCLDTSAYSHLVRGHAAASSAIRVARRVIVPVIVVGELRLGFRGGRRSNENEERLARFLAEPVVDVADIDATAADHYADIALELRRAGTPVASNDLWIAAIAARDGATVLTYDADFAKIRRVASRILAV